MQVCRRPPTRGGHSKGAVWSHSTMPQDLNEHAISMQVARTSTRAFARRALHVYFSTMSRDQSLFREFGSTSRSLLCSPPRSQVLCITKNLLHKLSASGKLICVLVVLIGVSTWLQFVVATETHLCTDFGFWLASWHGRPVWCDGLSQQRSPHHHRLKLCPILERACLEVNNLWSLMSQNLLQFSRSLSV